MSNYKATIGIEVHVELSTDYKVFSKSPNKFGAEVNTLINEIDLAMPGTLPTLNKQVIDMGIMCALALNAKINKNMYFERKNYFYPDNPKNFQITQGETPIGFDGYLEVNNQEIGIERLHIEEDTAKSIHDNEKTYLNFNRAGVPLLEIVTKPEIHDSLTAAMYIEKLRETLLYLGISDVKMEEGSMRCDVNISLSDNENLGTKVEIKNIGSIKYAKKAIEREIIRQTQILDAGQKIVQQTFRYDDAIGDNILMRTKETSNDYRYLPEADIPVVKIHDDWIKEIRDQMPILPDMIRSKLSSKGVNDNNIKALLKDKPLLDYVIMNIDNFSNIVTLVNLLISEIKAYMNNTGQTINEIIDHKDLMALVDDLNNSKVTKQDSKLIIKKLIIDHEDYKFIVGQLMANKVQYDLDQIINEILLENDTSVSDYKAGKDRAIKHLMGELMKKTKGVINPKVAKDKLLQSLKKLS